MNECAHGWITVALPMLFVGLDIVSVLAGSDEPPPTEERDFTVYQSLHPSDTIHILEWRGTRRVPATGRPPKHRKVFSSVGRDRWEV